METIKEHVPLLKVMVLRDNLWHQCRLGEVKAGETFTIWEGDTVIRRAIAIEDGRFDDACGGKIIAEVTPLDMSQTVTINK